MEGRSEGGQLVIFVQADSEEPRRSTAWGVGICINRYRGNSDQAQKGARCLRAAVPCLWGRVAGARSWGRVFRGRAPPFTALLLTGHHAQGVKQVAAQHRARHAAVSCSFALAFFVSSDLAASPSSAS